ncbi:Hyaluronoglucosaminidase precursor [Anaerovibrio sp. JC8]|uniref:protein O-GlcNAcase n=1 Tax=Anaerovibrio sp. JC8 TaxID=1240085 RepID=UPI000A09B599|nr:protein O-GlcNAcase [Anaerovibrio sp. JC8]ORU00444.1 Hyaluronoglucosaminidase precursor [Anaerovibrio sp. JC8]
MKMKLIFLLVICLIVLTLLPINAQADRGNSKAIPLRGVVEGFYGVPWTHEHRLDMLKFMASKKLNAYIYAPKDDEYHRKYWRQPYPEDKYRELQELTQKAKELKIDLIFAVSPGNDIAFSGQSMYEDRYAMINKMQAMYDIGIRHFALFFDDIPTKDAQGQADFVNWVNANFIKVRPDCSNLILVPTEYFLQDMEKNGPISDYTRTLAAKLDKDVLVLYTGEGVCPDGLSDKTVKQVNSIYGKPMGIWWNYPVTDFMKEKLALGPLDKMDKDMKAKDVPAFFINPMEKAELSKIAIATGADFANNPGMYDEKKSWEKAIKSQFGDLAEPMKIFASHSQRLENNWAHIGRPDAVELQLLYKNLWGTAKGKDTIPKSKTLDLLKKDNKKRERALIKLQAHLPKKYLDECQPQLRQLKNLTEAEKYALMILEKKPADLKQPELYKKFKDAKSRYVDNEASARISDDAVWKFVKDFDVWYVTSVGDENVN